MILFVVAVDDIVVAVDYIVVAVDYIAVVTAVAVLVSVVSVFAVVVVVVVDVAVSVFAVVAVVLVGVAEVISPLTPSLVAAFALLLLQDPRLEKWSTLSRNVVLASGVGLPGLVFQERRPQWAVSVLHEAPRGVLHLSLIHI